MPSVMDFRLTVPMTVGTEERELRRSVLTSTVHLLQHVFDQATTEDIQAAGQFLSQSVMPAADAGKQALVARFADGREYSPLERVVREAANMQGLFDTRHALLAGSLTTAGAAQLLGTTRQTPYDRAKKGTLLAITDRRQLRFPRWQFDPHGPGGVVAGLPDVLQALQISPFAKALWLTRSNPTFEGRTPLEALRAGEVERVQDAAAAVGVV